MQKTGKRPRSDFDKLPNISKPPSIPHITQDAPSSVVDVKQFVSPLTTTFLNAMPAADARDLRELALVAKEWCSKTLGIVVKPKRIEARPANTGRTVEITDRKTKRLMA
jgi:hypothetical protein